MTVSVATYDPGGWSDNFCGLYAKVTPENIRLTDAKFWSKLDNTKNQGRYLQDTQRIRVPLYSL